MDWKIVVGENPELPPNLKRVLVLIEEIRSETTTYGKEVMTTSFLSVAIACHVAEHTVKSDDFLLEAWCEEGTLIRMTRKKIATM